MTEGVAGQDRPGGGGNARPKSPETDGQQDNRKIQSRHQIGDRRESLGNGDSQDRSETGNSPSTEPFQIEDSSAPLDDKQRSRPVREV